MGNSEFDSRRGSGGRPLRVVFTVQHPAHVHLFRNAIDVLESRGDRVFVFARKKDIAIELLERCDIDHTVLAGAAGSLDELALRQAQYEAGLLWHASRIRPDVMIAMGEPGVAHVSTLVDCPGIIFTDTEYATLQNTLAFPLADRVCTPTCYQDDIGDKQVCYDGYHELAYLHPDRFTPQPDVLDEHGLDPHSSYAVLRLNAFNAAHFRGDAGFTDIRAVIERIEDSGTEVLVTSERDVPPSLEPYEISIPVERMHDVLYYADLFIGESATMAAESAVLGTPAIFVSTSRRGYTDELGDRYGLVYTFSGTDRQRAGLKRAVSILEEYDAEQWEQRHERLLADKIDTTEFIIDQIDSAASEYEPTLGDVNRIAPAVKSLF
jgi:predicted glycosyltransferase